MTNSLSYVTNVTTGLPWHFTNCDSWQLTCKLSCSICSRYQKQVTITSFHIFLNSLITGHPICLTLHSLELLTAWQYAVWATDSMTLHRMGYWQHDTTQSGLLTVWPYTVWATDSMTLHRMSYWQHDTTQSGLLTAWPYTEWSTGSMKLCSLVYWQHATTQPGILTWHYAAWSNDSKGDNRASLSCDNYNMD